MHLHGYKFWVVETGWLGQGDAKTASATETFPGVEKFRIRRGSNYVDPPFVDTVTMTQYSFVRLRIVADNPGMWHFHCHFLWHMMEGLQTVFNIGEPSQPVPSSSWLGGQLSKDLQRFSKFMQHQAYMD